MSSPVTELCEAIYYDTRSDFISVDSWFIFQVNTDFCNLIFNQMLCLMSFWDNTSPVTINITFDI